MYTKIKVLSKFSSLEIYSVCGKEIQKAIQFATLPIPIQVKFECMYTHTFTHVEVPYFVVKL